MPGVHADDKARKLTQSDLKTERLLLRSFHSDDANEVQVLAGNVNVSSMEVYEIRCAEQAPVVGIP
jgi:hypothetical protein